MQAATALAILAGIGLTGALRNAAAATIDVTSADQFQNSTVNVTPADTVRFAPGIGTFRFGGLTGGGSVTLADPEAGCVTLEVGGSGASSTFAGVLGGCGALTKTGAGTLTLSGSHTYTGPTSINAGVLRLQPPLPTVVGTLGLWLDAAQLPLANGASVSTWPDLSGNGRNATAGNAPTFVATNSAFNRLPTVRFNGSSHYLNVNLTFLAGSPYTIFAVTAKNASLDRSYFIGNNTEAWGPNNTILQCGWGGDTSLALRQYGNDLNWDGAPAFQAPPVACLYGGRLDTASGHYLYYNAVQRANNGNTTPLSASNSGAVGKVGMRRGSGGSVLDRGYFNGDIGEILVYRSALSDTDRRFVEGYLNAKWGLGIENLPRVGGNILPPETSVRIAPGASLSIGAVTNTVASLYLDGAKQDHGTWGSRASAAAHVNDVYFADSGMLSVSYRPTGPTLLVR